MIMLAYILKMENVSTIFSLESAEGGLRFKSKNRTEIYHPKSVHSSHWFPVVVAELIFIGSDKVINYYATLLMPDLMVRFKLYSYGI